jgi:fimbrial isopeptide formation D2 family protein
MKNAKRLASLMLALVMVFAMAISVSADQTEIPANTGSILIQNNNTINASEKTFQAYKILDLKAYANDAGEILTYEYTVPAGMEDFYAEYFSLDKNDPHFLSQLTGAIENVAKKDLYTFARAAIEASNGVITPVTGEAVANGYQFANLPLGYYAIEDVTGAGEVPVSAIVLTSGTPNVVIEVKASKPSIDKKIDDDNNLDTTEDRVEINDAAIGDTVTYVITSKVPENMDGYDKYFFIMNDQLDKSLTYGNDLQITLGGEVLTEGEDYILTTTQNENGTALKIVFVDFIQYENAGGQPIEAVYTATLNEDAVLNPEANYNKVNL